LRKQGQIGLNHGAIEKFGIEDGQFALLGYDREKKMVAIRLLTEPSEGSKKVIVRAKSGSIAAKGFIDYFGIMPQETRAYPLSEDMEHDCLVFYLEEEREAGALHGDPA
jgi:hypothetical protein